MDESPQPEAMELANIKKLFDEVLVRNIQRLLEVDSVGTSLSFNLSTIACLLLLVERENEIRNFPDSPPERYTRETFLDELSDLGLAIDDTLMVSFQALAQQGYVEIDNENRYNVQISTFAIVSFLDNLFPGMKGMNLVAYILQMISEVESGRKDLDDAISQFDQTLQSKGISLSKQNMQPGTKADLEAPVAKKADLKKARQVSEDLKKAYKQKLERLRNKTVSKESGQKTAAGRPKSAQLRVKEIFPKSDLNMEDQAGEEAATDTESEEVAQAHLEAEKQAAQAEAAKAAIEAERKAAEIAAQEAEIKAREAELRAKEAEIAAREAEARLQAEKEAQQKAPEPEPTSPKDDIEEKIAAFEATLAIQCPVCNAGKVVSDRTEKGQEYYACTNQQCGFVSWSKPYPFTCPICKNLFLIEVSASDGSAGLKCPRATCSYQQNHLGPPQQGPDSPSPKKKKRLVRRVRRKR